MSSLKSIVSKPLSLVVGLALSALIIACGQAAEPTTAVEPTPATTPVAPTSTPVRPTGKLVRATEPAAERAPTPEPAPVWKADGVVSEGEYAHKVDAAGVTLHWANDSEFLYGALSAKTEGWVAVAFDPEARMKGANFVFGWVKGGETTVMDMYGAKPSGRGSHPVDTSLGGTDDIAEFAGMESNGATTIEFKIPLESGDAYDKPLAPGETVDILLAQGASDDLAYHKKRGAATITLDR